MATVSLEGLTRRHRGADRPALDRLDLEVRDGELLVLVGPSGCGKSTALRLIAGLDEADAGRVRIDGRDVTTAAPQDRDVAMVFQGYALYPHMSARDNIAFPLKMKGIQRAERARRVAEVADLLGLGKLLDRRPGELSGGERQRVAMGRAIVRRPKVFLFDEPLANLDAALRGELRVELAALVRRLGTTAIYVTHDQAEAMTMGDRIAVLRDGRLQQIAPPRAIYEAPTNLFVAGFLGAPPMNLVEVAATPGGYEGGGLALPRPRASMPASVTVGVRPEHVALLAVAPESAGAVASEGTAGATAAPATATADGERADRGDDAPIRLRAMVISREPLGAETHLRVEAGGVSYWARVPGFDAPALGETIEARVDPRRVLWFDRSTGERLDLVRRGEAT